jgi:hypothetical protein
MEPSQLPTRTGLGERVDLANSSGMIAPDAIQALQAFTAAVDDFGLPSVPTRQLAGEWTARLHLRRQCHSRSPRTVLQVLVPTPKAAELDMQVITCII